MQQSTGQQPVIDSNLLSHIQTLTSQLLNKKPPEPGFNKVDKQFLPPKKDFIVYTNRHDRRRTFYKGCSVNTHMVPRVGTLKIE